VSAEKGKRSAATSGSDPLFHCSNIQGVILGIGLSMLEQWFSEQGQESTDNQDHKARTSKKRKMDATSNSTSAQDLDDDDDVYYANVQGRKNKGGVGYAGDQREDVSASHS
jgi:hypothetical protein